MSTEVRKRKWDQEDDGLAAGGAAAGGAPNAAASSSSEQNKQPKLEGTTNGQDAPSSAASAAAAPAPAANGSGAPPAPALSAADAAVAAAARIAAQYAKPNQSGSRSPAGQKDHPDEGTFTKDIDINDSRNRYLLTRGSTQDEVKANTGALVVTKGTWLPDRTKATEKDPPLYIHVSATSQEILDKGVAAIEELLDMEMAPLVTDFRAKAREEREARLAEQGPRERRKWPEEKLPIGLQPLRNFNVRAKIVGPQGLFVKYIQNETAARVQIKGMGSGFVENETGRESDEPMHVHVSGPEQIMVDRANELAEDLLIVVKEEWAKAKAVLDQWQQGDQQQHHQQGYAPPPPSYNAPPPPPGANAPPPPPDGSAPPPPPGSAGPPAPPAPAGSPSGPPGDIIAQAQALAPTIDVTLLQFYAGHSQDPATIVYYAQMALYYQQQGYTGEGQPPAQPAAPTPATAAAQQHASANAYGTPTQGGYGGQPPPHAYAGSPYNQGYGGEDRSRQAKGQYGNMPPPPGL